MGTVSPIRSRAEASGPFVLSPQDMVVFAAIGRAEGVRGAAAALGIPRSTVSRQLAKLEGAVGAPLVVRTTRRFALTPLGSALADRCEQLEELLRGAEKLVGEETSQPTGTLRLTASPLVGDELLPAIVAEYLARFPQMRVDVNLTTDFLDLRKANVDLAIRTGPLENASDLYATRLGTSLKGLYASPRYLARRGVPSHPSELAAHDCIGVGRPRQTGWALRAVSVPLTPRLRANSYKLARDAAVAGAGILHVSRFFVAELVAEGTLVPILEASWPRLTLHAVHASGTPAPPKIREFIALLKAGLADLL